MSRNYAQMPTARWRDEAFRALTAGAQHMHMLLESQPDISAAGVLAMNVTRWANRARDTTRQTVVAALQELQERGWVVYDTDTEEVWVRTFIDTDGGHSNPKRRPSIRRAVEDIESPKIRRALVGELRRLVLPMEWVADSLSTPRPDGGGEGPSSTPTPDNDDQLSSQANSLSGSHADSDAGSDGVVVTQGLFLVPQPTTHDPQPVPPPADAPTARRRKPADPNAPAKANAIVGAYCDGATNAGLDRPSGKLCARIGRDAKRLLAEGKPLDRLITAATEMGAGGWNDLDVAYRRAEAIAKGVPAARRPPVGGYQPYQNPSDQSVYLDWGQAQ